MLSAIAQFGALLTQMVAGFGDFCRFCGQTFSWIVTGVRRPGSFRLILPQMLEIGTRSLSKQQWACNVLNLMVRYSPTALKASFAMLQKARSERLSLVDCMALEYRCFIRLMMTPDFIRAQV